MYISHTSNSLRVSEVLFSNKFHKYQYKLPVIFSGSVHKLNSLYYFVIY